MLALKYWDVAIAVVGFLIQCGLAWLGLTLTHWKHKAAFFLLVLTGAVFTGFAVKRGIDSAGQVQAQLNTIQKNTEKPQPGPVINVSPTPVNFPAQEAFVTITARHLELFRRSDHILVNFAVGNISSAAPSLNEYGFDQVYIVEAQPIGINKEMLVDQSVEDKSYKSFVKAMAKIPLPLQNSKTIGPQQSSFASGFGPILDEGLEKEIRNGNKAIFLAAEFFWEDGGGKHVNEVCQWLQPDSFRPGALEVWHFCNHHNGIRK